MTSTYADQDQFDLHPTLDSQLLRDVIHPSRSLWTPRELRDLTSFVASELTTGLLSILDYSTERRWWARLGLTEGVELWLLSWLPGQGTEPHDHGGSAGSFTVLTGTVAGGLPLPGRTDPVRGAGHRGRARLRRPGGRTRCCNPFDGAGGDRARLLAAARADPRVRVAARHPRLDPAAARAAPAAVRTASAGRPGGPVSNLDTILEEARSHLKRLEPHDVLALEDVLVVDIRPAHNRLAEGEIENSVVGRADRAGVAARPGRRLAAAGLHRGHDRRRRVQRGLVVVAGRAGPATGRAAQRDGPRRRLPRAGARPGCRSARAGRRRWSDAGGNRCHAGNVW